MKWLNVFKELEYRTKITNILIYTGKHDKGSQNYHHNFHTFFSYGGCDLGENNVDTEVTQTVNEIGSHLFRHRCASWKLAKETFFDDMFCCLSTSQFT